MQISLPIWTEGAALRVLRGHAWRADQLADLLARQAMRAAAGGGFDVARDALDELLVRFDRSTRERPEIEPRVGWFTAQGHEVWIGSLAPLEASCDCRDFIRASLGACVHVLSALRYGGTAPRIGAPGVSWDPIRPLDGAQAWWARARGIGSDAPAVRALIERDARLRVPRVEPSEIDAQLATLRMPLFEYQRAGVHAFFASGRLVLADDMGLGKTAQAIAIGHVLFRIGAIARALVIVPAPLKYQWADEWRRFSTLEPRVVEGGPDDREQEYARPGVAIVGYEQARRDRERLGAFELVILDEAQRIKNASTLTARELKQLEPRWRLALTGTPLENRLDEVASIASWVDDLALEPAWRLRSWHAVRSDAGEGIGVRALDTIRERLQPHFLRRVRADVIGQLPARRDTQIPVLLGVRQREMHDALQLAIARVVGALQSGRAKSGRAKRDERLLLQRLLAEQRLVCNGVALARFDEYWLEIESAREPAVLLSALHSPKLGILRELLGSLVVEQSRKVVVFSQWRRMLRIAERMTADVLPGVRTLYFTGEETPQRRLENLARFHDAPDVGVLWATDVGALGLNLQSAASSCINLELPWNPAVLEQRVARIHRFGQAEPVDVYNLVTIDGIEGRIAHLLDTKQSLFHGLFSTSADEIRFDGNPGGPSTLWLALAGTSGNPCKDAA